MFAVAVQIIWRLATILAKIADQCDIFVHMGRKYFNFLRRPKVGELFQLERKFNELGWPAICELPLDRTQDAYNY